MSRFEGAGGAPDAVVAANVQTDVEARAGPADHPLEGVGPWLEALWGVWSKITND